MIATEMLVPVGPRNETTDPGIEIELRRLTSRLSVTLLRTIGGAHLSQIVSFADYVRDQVRSGPAPANEDAVRAVALSHANQWLASHNHLRIDSPLDQAATEDFLVALLWSTHGALPPRVSDAVVLRTLLSVSAGESGQILGIPAQAVDPLVQRAVRRTRAFGLDVRRPGPQEFRRGVLTATQRLRGLAARITRSAVAQSAPFATKLIDEWVTLIKGTTKARRTLAA